MRAASAWVGAALLALSLPAAAPGLDAPVGHAGVALPGERVLLGDTALGHVTVSFALAASAGPAEGKLVRVSCAFACFETSEPAPPAGQRELYPVQGGQALYFVAGAFPVAYAASVTPGYPS